jgi:anti-sigma-K factor RskA
MINEEKEEQGSLYVLGLLPEKEADQFAAAMREDAQLREFVDELQASAAALAHADPPMMPPPRVRHQLLGRIREQRAAALTDVTSQSRFTIIPWALAACLTILAVALAMERSRLRTQIVELRDKDALTTLRIASLSSQLQGVKGQGAIAWSTETQRGLLKLEKMPPLERNQDYQLWVIDPRYPQPVSGGIVRVDPEGNAVLTFTVDVPIRNADKFAISRERTGGAMSPEGPIVMMSN